MTSPLRKVRTPVSPLPSTDFSSSGTEVSSMLPRSVRPSSSSGSRPASPIYAFPASRPMSAFSQSIGTGKTIVEFFSAAISTSVCR